MMIIVMIIMTIIMMIMMMITMMIIVKSIMMIIVKSIMMIIVKSIMMIMIGLKWFISGHVPIIINKFRYQGRNFWTVFSMDLGRDLTGRVVSLLLGNMLFEIHSRCWSMLEAINITYNLSYNKKHIEKTSERTQRNQSFRLGLRIPIPSVE